VDINTTKEDDTVVIQVEGEVDMASSPVLREKILSSLEAPDGTVAVDLSRVTYMDSSGVATLVEGLRASQRSGGGFVILSPSRPVQEVFKLTKLCTVFTIKECV
jgi:anti-sigma B factor antagonist